MTQTTTHNMQATQPYYLLGAGAMGLLWVANLLRASSQPRCDVSIITRDPISHSQNDYKQNVENNHLQFSFAPFLSDGSSTPVRQFQVERVSASQLRKSGRRISQMIIVTKAYDLIDAFQSVRDSLDENARVLVLANGIGFQQTLIDLAAEQQKNISLYFAVSSDGARLDSHTLYHTGIGETYIGELAPHNAVNSQSSTASSFALPEDFALRVKQSDDIARYIWRKFFINCAINMLTIKFDCNNGGLLEHPYRQQVLQEITAELQDVVDAVTQFDKTRSANHFCGLSLDTIPQFNVLEASTKVIQQTATNTSSALTDWRNGKVTEIDYLNGQFIKLAESIGVECAHHRQLLKDVRQQSN